jgi:hypothetical protein
MKIVSALLAFALGVAALLAADAPQVAERWIPLWDGRTFAGWHAIGEGEWKIEHGTIHGRRLQSEPGLGFLVTNQTYTDFTIRARFKVGTGNSGLFFRLEEIGDGTVRGYQAEIDATQGVGGLYESKGRKWISEPTAAQVATWFKPGEWNELRVSAHAGHIVVTVNGKKSAELADDPGRRSGKIAIQVHGRPLGCDVWFRDIEILAP